MSHHPVDVYVGSRIKHQRTVSGISQEKLGSELGLTFQQVQKYEKGANRVGASRLFQISKILNVSPAFFFEGMPEDPVNGYSPGMAEESAGFEHDNLSKRETLELVRAYYKIDDTDVRKRIFDLIKSIGGQEDEGAE
ncbi:helix-turn-helix domain-containing protein [Sneathiella sp. P13V-1]|uniref:helix-turn-helix domain-containing protein n=1 Tax=Sneathiella sp. P13V-1 TaxID=2697366 RepID=UPI00187B228B|nr:helix-turn-helix transcriptional regulator [Sneathiella sp. P13V-1]MBE7635858.1 helix-turn-helix domain-containing protein [Sneathiella sp. P13V-1]